MDPRRSELVEANLPLVEQVVLRVSGSFPRFVDRSELVAAGTLGLVEAALRYDFDRGIPFAGYAVRRIRGAVIDVARSADWTSRSVRSLERQVDNVSQEVATSHRCAPTDDLVAQRLGVNAGEIRRMRQSVEVGVSQALQGRAGIERRNAEEIADAAAECPEEALEQLDMKGYVRAALDSLPERLRIVVVGVYLEERPLEEIARLLGVTSSRVSQLRSDALEMIRHGIESQFEAPASRKPKGRVEIRQAQYAAAIASHSDLRTRLSESRRQRSTAATTGHARPSLSSASKAEGYFSGRADLAVDESELSPVC